MPDDKPTGAASVPLVSIDSRNQDTWTFDIQRGLAWTIVLLFVAVVGAFLLRVAISANIDDVNDGLKSALAVLFNVVMLVLGYFFGSSKSSQSKDDTQNKIIEKLTPPPPPTPVAVVVDQPPPDRPAGQ